MQFLIRSNVEGEGWVNDGIFAPKEAAEQIAAMLRTEQIARNEGHFFVFAVLVLDPKQELPYQAKRSSDNQFMGRGQEVYFTGKNSRELLRVPAPPALDY